MKIILASVAIITIFFVADRYVPQIHDGIAAGSSDVVKSLSEMIRRATPISDDDTSQEVALGDPDSDSTDGGNGGDASNTSSASVVGSGENAEQASGYFQNNDNSANAIGAGDSDDDAGSDNDNSSNQILANSASAISASTPTSSIQTPGPAQTCSFSEAGAPNRQVILNEIAWMGSLPQAGETTAKAGEREWIELKNISSETVDLSNWQILDAVGNLKIFIGAGKNIESVSGGGTDNGTSTPTLNLPSGGFFLLVRDGDSLPGAQTDAGYTGGLSNSGGEIVLFDSNCETSDLLDASTGWPGGNNTTKQTLERDADGNGWHTSAEPGGTPGAENSAPAPSANSSSTTNSSISTSSSLNNNTKYIIAISSSGGGAGTVSSNPAGIACGFACEGNFAGGTSVTLTATPQAGSKFDAWSGGCSGGSPACSLVVTSSISITATFNPVATSTGSTNIETYNAISPPSETSSTSTATSSGLATHLLIAQVQIGGASSSNDFVRIFNPTGGAIDISGWKLHKKSSTGTDYSLKTFVTGNTISAGGYFTWANSEGGFSETIGADASSTETLSADNSVALFDANGNIVDQVAWGTGTNQYVEGSAFPTDPTAGQIFERATTNGTMTDMNNNASDFTLE